MSHPDLARSLASVDAWHPDESQPAPDWPDPLPLPGGLFPVPLFQSSLVPEALREWVADIANRAQCPIEYVAVSAVVGLGAVVGRRRKIYPKRHDDWVVVPNLWGACVGPPGVMKSPAMKEALRPLDRLVAQAQESFKGQSARIEAERIAAEARRAMTVKEIKAAGERNDDLAELAKRLGECSTTAPTERRYHVNDATVEKLGELLNLNPNGLLLYRDELAGFLRQLDRDGHENDRAFYLEAWNGDGSYIYDRIGRGTVRIEAACLSVLGGIQPGPLADYLTASARDGKGADGFLQRFQLLVQPDQSPEWRNVDRYPETGAKNRAFRVYERLAEESAVEGWRFTSEAQDEFDAWRARLEPRLREPDGDPVMVGHLAKYRSLLPKLALLFTLADESGGSVDRDHLRLAVRWCDLLEAHARRVYQPATNRAATAARRVSDKIKAGKLPSPFTARDVYRPEWAGLDRETVPLGLELLEELGWIRARTVATAGRAREEYAINPAVLPKVRQ